MEHDPCKPRLDQEVSLTVVHRKGGNFLVENLQHGMGEPNLSHRVGFHPVVPHESVVTLVLETRTVDARRTVRAMEEVEHVAG